MNVLLLLFACAIPLAILLLPMAGLSGILEKIDWHSPFYIFSLQLGAGTLLFIKLFKDFAIWAKEVWQNNSKPTLIILAIITIMISAICIFWIEGRSRVQMDESIYSTTALNLYYNQIGTYCGEGYFTENGLFCKPDNTVKPRGLSFLYMLAMPIFGTDLHWIYNFQVFILALTIPIFFFALLAWLKNKELALLSATLLGMQPVLLFYSRSSSIEGFYILMLAISLLFLKWAYDRDTTRHWLLLALTLAFFAQTRSETVFCLFAFIGVLLYRKKTLNQLSTKFSHIATFLATLSFFSIPILCTLSLNRDSDLQGGPHGARGHLFSNIIDDFKIMAFPNYDSNGLLSQPFLPYFTWLCLFGILALIILTARELFFKKTLNSQLSTKFSHIAAFLLLLSPQYIILFDSVSADLNLNVQSRFVLIILPAMSFLGALFIWQIITLLKNQVNPKILIIGVLTIICTATLVHFNSFKANILFRHNSMTTEDYLYKEFIAKTRESSSSNMIFFSFNPNMLISHGTSAYSYLMLFKTNDFSLEELLKIYNGNVFITENSSCGNSPFAGSSKMNVPIAFRLCDRLLRYFDVDTVLDTKLNKESKNSKKLTIYKILGMNDIDPKGLLRITQKIEPDSNTVNLSFLIPRDTIAPWQVKHFINDSLISTSNYKAGDYVDIFNFSEFTLDTNKWRLDIVDTLTGNLVHSDFWELVKVKND